MSLPAKEINDKRGYRIHLQIKDVCRFQRCVYNEFLLVWEVADIIVKVNFKDLITHFEVGRGGGVHYKRAAYVLLWMLHRHGLDLNALRISLQSFW